MMLKVSVLGAGSWGTTLGAYMAEKGNEVVLYDYVQNQVEEINKKKTNNRYLPGLALPDNLQATLDLSSALKDADYVFIALPSHVIREVLVESVPSIKPDAILINCSKGIEDDTYMRISQVIEDVLGQGKKNRVVVLSGPTHAEEVSRGLPSAAVAASIDDKPAVLVQKALMSATFRIYTSNDVVGVELGGAVKNIIAIAAGISDGLGFGDNTKAALITRGLQEIWRLGCVLGANRKTFAGLAGLGDLVVTCASKHSRNWNFGFRIGQGMTIEEAQKDVDQVVEGVRTTQAVHLWARENEVDMPITAKVYEVLFRGRCPREGVFELMCRLPKTEMPEN